MNIAKILVGKPNLGVLSCRSLLSGISGARLYGDKNAPNTIEKELVAPSLLVEKNKKDLQQKDKNVDKSKVTVKGPILSTSKYESTKYVLPKWKESIGSFVISALRLDMDRIRAGAVAGSHYYGLCKEQGLYKQDEQYSKSADYWYNTLGMEPTFAQWFHITSLHMWILFVKMRSMPFKYGKNYQQKIVDRFFSDMELRLTEELNIQSGRMRDQYLKEFDNQLRGSVLAYDEALVSDDITMAYAVWRNMYNAKQDVDIVALESIVRYIRSQLYVLSKTSDRQFAFGKFSFVPPDEIVYRLTKEEETKLQELAYKDFEDVKVYNKSKLSLNINE